MIAIFCRGLVRHRGEQDGCLQPAAASQLHCLTCGAQLGAAHWGQLILGSALLISGQVQISSTWGTDNHVPIGQCDVAQCFAWPNDAIFLPKHLSVTPSCHPFFSGKAYSTSAI